MPKEWWWIALAALGGALFVLLGFVFGSAVVFASVMCQ